MRLLLLVWLRVRYGIVRQAWQIDHVPVGCGPHRATGVRPERPAWVGSGEGSMGDGGVLEDGDRLYRWGGICVGDRAGFCCWCLSVWVILCATVYL